PPRRLEHAAAIEALPSGSRDTSPSAHLSRELSARVEDLDTASAGLRAVTGHRAERYPAVQIRSVVGTGIARFVLQLTDLLVGDRVDGEKFAHVCGLLLQIDRARGRTCTSQCARAVSSRHAGVLAFEAS